MLDEMLDAFVSAFSFSIVFVEFFEKGSEASKFIVLFTFFSCTSVIKLKKTCDINEKQFKLMLLGKLSRKIHANKSNTGLTDSVSIQRASIIYQNKLLVHQD